MFYSFPFTVSICLKPNNEKLTRSAPLLDAELSSIQAPMFVLFGWHLRQFFTVVRCHNFWQWTYQQVTDLSKKTMEKSISYRARNLSQCLTAHLEFSGRPWADAGSARVEGNLRNVGHVLESWELWEVVGGFCLSLYVVTQKLSLLPPWLLLASLRLFGIMK